MVADVHIEGMGWLGSALAVELDRRGVTFTWNDIDAPHTAWPVSTGAVYPAGDDLSANGLLAWSDWVTEGRFGSAAAFAPWWYTQKSPPHKGPKAAEDVGFARRSSQSAVAVDVRRIVTETRALYADCRVDTPPSNVDVVVAHGWGDRFDRAVWGWARRVKVIHPFDGPPPMIYVRRNRFQFGYLYPIPGTGLHWAGSSLIVQRDPHRLNGGVHEARWAKLFTEDASWLRVEPVGEVEQGWRPRSADESTAVTVDARGRISVPPLWHSGVRWAPGVVADVCDRLGV